MATGRFCISNSTSHEFLNTIITTECNNDEFFQVWATLVTFFDYFEYQAWFFALIGSSMVGLSGVFPLFIIPEDEDDYHNTQGGNSGLLKFLLSFAVGGLLGDVFLHLLPEAWSNFTEATKGGQPSMTCGLWVLGGFLVFVIAEKLFNGCNYEEIHTPSEPKKNFKYECDNNNVLNESEKKELYKKNGYNGLKKINGLNNGFLKCDGFSSKSGLLNENYVYEKIAQVRTKEKSKHITGYLNLIANCVDNFTHGLAIGGSFLVSFRLGALTTFAILIHEIPHEIGDFAILLKSGFSRLDAAKAQIITATGGICGAFFAIMFSGDAVEAKTSWILPFTAGGFLHIGMVTILPELLQETDAKESLKQLSGFITGIIIMATLTIFFD